MKKWTIKPSSDSKIAYMVVGYNENDYYDFPIFNSRAKAKAYRRYLTNKANNETKEQSQYFNACEAEYYRDWECH